MSKSCCIVKAIIFMAPFLALAGMFCCCCKGTAEGEEKCPWHEFLVGLFGALSGVHLIKLICCLHGKKCCGGSCGEEKEKCEKKCGSHCPLKILIFVAPFLALAGVHCFVQAMPLRNYLMGVFTGLSFVHVLKAFCCHFKGKICGSVCSGGKTTCCGGKKEEDDEEKDKKE